MCQVLLDARDHVMINTDQVLALGECPFSTLNSLLNSRLMWPDVYLAFD